MPRRTDLHRILVIGSGPIVIGQAAEFDYSGTQATKALREEGYEVILVNSNPATIMTDPEFADRTYLEPVTPEFVEKVIERERPDAVLPTMGGQTALNVALALLRQRRAGEVRLRADRRQRAGHPGGRRPQAVRRGDGEDRPQVPDRPYRHLARGSARRRRGDRLPGHHPPVVHARRHRWRHRVQSRGVRDDGAARPRPVAGALGAHRALAAGLEGVRARGDARLTPTTS